MDNEYRKQQLENAAFRAGTETVEPADLKLLGGQGTDPSRYGRDEVERTGLGGLPSRSDLERRVRDLTMEIARLRRVLDLWTEDTDRQLVLIAELRRLGYSI